MGNLIPEIRLQERLTSALLILSLACCSDGSSLVCCELARGEVHMTRIRGQSLANSQWGVGSPQSNSLGGTDSCQLLLVSLKAGPGGAALASTSILACERPFADNPAMLC